MPDLAFQGIINNELGFFVASNSHDYEEGAPLDANSTAAHNPVDETHEAIAVQGSGILNNEDGSFDSPTSLLVNANPFDGSTPLVQVEETHFASVLHNVTGIETGVDPLVFSPVTGPPPLIDPSLSVISASADAAHLVTIDWASAVDSNITSADVFFEVEQTPGNKVRFTGPTGVDFSLAASFQDTFSVPVGQNYNGKVVSVVVKSTATLQEFSSAGFTMLGVNFDNSITPSDPAFTNPNPQVITVDVGIDSIALLVAEAGPTDAPFVTVRWEADLVPGEITVVLLELRNELMPIRRTFSDSVQIPPTLNLQGSSMRFVVVPQPGLVAEV